MKIIKSYKFRLKPSKEQIDILLQHGGNTRFVWNKLLEYSKECREKNDKYPTQSKLQEQVIQLKEEYDFLNNSYSQPLQINAQKLVKAYIKAFRSDNVASRKIKIAKAMRETDKTKKAKKLDKAYNYAFPKFKSKRDNHDAIFYPQHFVIKKSKILFPKIGWISYIKHRNIEGKPLSLTIKQDGNQWYVAIPCEVEIATPHEKALKDLEKANIVGIDVGLDKFATLSDKTEVKNPRTLKKHLKKLKREQKRLSRKILKSTGKIVFGKEIKASSENRKKQISKVQKVHRKVRNIRKDFLHKLTYSMITKYDGFALETLDIQEMMQNNTKAMSRSIGDVSWSEYFRFLEYKSEWYGKYFVQIGQWEPSTQTCSQCGSRQEMALEDRMFVCKHCGFTCPRDLNSALYIEKTGRRMLKEQMEEQTRLKNKKNTAGTAGINACGHSPVGLWDGIEGSSKKQEKRCRRAVKYHAIEASVAGR